MKLPQLSLRELFLLVALIAMGCGWWVDRAHARREYDALFEAFDKTDARLRELTGQMLGPTKLD
jgi:hypothetical protein